MSSVNRNAPTYVVPCFQQFFYVLYLQDTQMVQTKRFTDANTAWCPLVSQLYFAILIYYHVLTCQKVGGHISIEQMQFLEFLEENCNVKHAKIPGPLVPFFQGLAANAGLNEDFGNYVFGIPNNLVVTRGQQFLAANRIFANLPCVTQILDQFMRYLLVVAPPAAAPVAITAQHTDWFYSNIYGVASAAAAPTEVTMMTPNARFPVPMTVQVVNNLVSSAATWYNVLPFNAAASTYVSGALAGNIPANQNLTFPQILGFQGIAWTANNFYGWFNTVGKLMQPYADFFKDSVSLGAVNTSGIGSIYVIATPDNANANAAIYTAAPQVRAIRFAAAGGNKFENADFSVMNTVAFRHPLEHLDLVAEQLGMLTQLNFDWSLLNLNPNTVYPGPLRGNISIGPINDLPDYRQRQATQIANKIENAITGYYHVPAAMKFE